MKFCGRSGNGLRTMPNVVLRKINLRNCRCHFEIERLRIISDEWREGEWARYVGML